MSESVEQVEARFEAHLAQDPPPMVELGDGWRTQPVWKGFRVAPFFISVQSGCSAYSAPREDGWGLGECSCLAVAIMKDGELKPASWAPEKQIPRWFNPSELGIADLDEHFCDGEGGYVPIDDVREIVRQLAAAAQKGAA